MWTILRTLIWQQYYSCFPDGLGELTHGTAKRFGQSALNIYRHTCDLLDLGYPEVLAY
jgi:hypothetical protein